MLVGAKLRHMSGSKWDTRRYLDMDLRRPSLAGGELETFGPSPRIKVRRMVDTTGAGNDELGVG